MNILFLRFPLESRFGGAEVQTLSLMRGLNRRGHTVSFLGSCSTLLRESGKWKVESGKLDIGPPPVTKWGAFSFLWRKKKMQQLLNSQLSTLNSQLDALFMLSLSEKILLTPFALKQGIKVIWIEHDKVGNWLTKNPWLSTLKKLSRRVTTVCVSELSANIFRDLGYENVVAIPNGVEEVTSDKSSSNQVQKDVLIVGCIARRSPEKGVDLLEKAIEGLDGVEFLFNETGSGEDIEEFYSKIDILVLPSREEDPFGLVIAEAAMRGIATICTDACGIAGYLENGVDSVIVEAGSVDALRDSIKQMKKAESRKRIAKKGKEAALKKFTVESMVSRYVDIIDL